MIQQEGENFNINAILQPFRQDNNGYNTFDCELKTLSYFGIALLYVGWFCLFIHHCNHFAEFKCIT